MPSTDRTYPRNTMLCWKKWHFFVLFFKLKSFSLLNTILIWSNISLTLVVKMHISSRYNSKVTNCWSPKHISIRWKKLDLNLTNWRESLWIHTILMIQLKMLSYECLAQLLAFANSLAPSQMMKTIGSYAQLAMPHLYGVKGRYPLPQESLIYGSPHKVKPHQCSCIQSPLGRHKDFLMV